MGNMFGIHFGCLDFGVSLISLAGLKQIAPEHTRLDIPAGGNVWH